MPISIMAGYLLLIFGSAYLHYRFGRVGLYSLQVRALSLKLRRLWYPLHPSPKSNFVLEKKHVCNIQFVRIHIFPCGTK
jgi:hypothetical protein